MATGYSRGQRARRLLAEEYLSVDEEPALHGTFGKETA